MYILAQIQKMHINLFHIKLIKAYTRCLPIMNTKGTYASLKKPWITNRILKLRKVKNKLYRKLLKSPTDINEITYKHFRNAFNKINKLIAAKETYYHLKFNESKGNLRHTWKLINKVSDRNRSKECTSDQFKEDEKIITDPNKIATKFNEYLVNVRPNSAIKIPTNQQTYKSYLKQRNMKLIKSQYGFRAGHSTQHAIIELIDKVSLAIERNKYTVERFLDLSKAFDTVNHEIHVLLHKLHHYRVRGTLPL